MSNSGNESSQWPKWATEEVEIAEPDASWAKIGLGLQQQLSSQLAPFRIEAVEHIGSTSIPGLPAKPIIDLMASIDSFDNVTGIAELLSLSGWHYVPPELDQRLWRRFFIKVSEGRRFAHLHLIESDNKTKWNELLLFRDRLRSSPELAQQYARLKLTLAKQFANDREAYTNAKTEFIRSILDSVSQTNSATIGITSSRKEEEIP